MTLSAGVDVHGDNSEDDDHDDDNDKSPEDTGNCKTPIINIPDTAIKTKHHTSNSTDNSETPGVGTPGKSAGVGINVETVKEDNDNAEEEREQLARKMDEPYGARQHLINLRDRKPRSYEHLNDGDIYNYDQALLTFEDPLGELFLTKQLSLAHLKKGLKHFGKAGAEAVVKEMKQLDYLDVMDPIDATELTPEERKRALDYHMYLKEKRDGRIKARGCADG
jgi:hypothetical protein